MSPVAETKLVTIAAVDVMMTIRVPTTVTVPSHSSKQTIFDDSNLTKSSVIVSCDLVYTNVAKMRRLDSAGACTNDIDKATIDTFWNGPRRCLIAA